MNTSDWVLVISIISYICIDFLLFKYLREKNWKGLIPYLVQLHKKK